MNMAKIVLIVLIGSMLGGCAGGYWEYHDRHFHTGGYYPKAVVLPMEDYDGRYAQNPGAEAAMAAELARVKRKEQRALEQEARCYARGGCTKKQVRAWDDGTRFNFRDAIDPDPDIIFVRP